MLVTQGMTAEDLNLANGILHARPSFSQRVKGSVWGPNMEIHFCTPKWSTGRTPQQAEAFSQLPASGTLSSPGTGDLRPGWPWFPLRPHLHLPQASALSPAKRTLPPLWEFSRALVVSGETSASLATYLASRELSPVCSARCKSPPGCHRTLGPHQLLIPFSQAGLPAPLPATWLRPPPPAQRLSQLVLDPSFFLIQFLSHTVLRLILLKKVTFLFFGRG